MNNIVPVKLASPGTCLHCGKTNNLILVELETSITEIMDNGQPYKTENTSYQSKLFCASCKKCMEFIKKGIYFIPIPPMNDKPIKYYEDINPFHKPDDD